MTAPVSRLDHAGSAVSSIGDALRPGERVDAYLERTASRRLSVVAPATRRLQATDGAFGGYLRVERDGRETYAPVGNASPDGLARALSVSRRARHLGHATPARRPARHSPAAGRWQNTPERFDVRSVDVPAWLDAVDAALGPGRRATAMDVTEVLHEAVFAPGDGPARGSVTYGVEVAVAAGDPAVVVTRYAATADRLDLCGLGRELRLTAHRADDATGFDGRSVVLTPSAAARLVSGLAGSVVADPGPETGPLTAALVDDARVADGHAARAVDCEGTPTGRTDLVGVDGRPARLCTRASRPGDGADLTGHARWDPVWKQPRLRTTTVFLDGRGPGDRLLDGDRCVVVDVRALGIAANQAGRRMTYRLHAVRAVDGEPVAGYAPFTVSGDLAAFLTSVTDVGAPEAFLPGEFATGGGFTALDLSPLDVRSAL